MPSIRVKRLCRRRALPNEALSPSRRKNDKTGLTASGSSKAAAAVNGLEGPSDKVMATVSRIGADDRHGDVEVLDQQQPTTRSVMKKCANRRNEVSTIRVSSVFGARRGRSWKKAETRIPRTCRTGFAARGRP
ncbi:BLUF domain-containing protein [Paracoccus actinidiae]|uniref:BLUF domain-containing protein n=1 Tax=Paracoccus actinidiae TaxID=3064531 RepID=UPI00359C2C21